MKSKCVFYLILFLEILLWPFLYLNQIIIKNRRLNKNKGRNRKPIESSTVVVGVHEWGGYPLERKKTIKNGVTFNCGLKYQIERFCNKEKIDLIVTMSDPHKYQNLKYIKEKALLIEVDNEGMDFSGYNAVYNYIKDRSNCYVILTNSSVNSVQEEFLLEYINYMEKNLDVGMLGISYCTKMVQSLIRNNFTPHLQSFFLLTTLDVLKEIVAFNKGYFPGVGITYKLLLIRRGEIRISQLVQKMGYKLAVVNPLNGKPFKFTDFTDWNIPFGDIRQIIDKPNRITPIKNDNSFNSRI